VTVRMWRRGLSIVMSYERVLLALGDEVDKIAVMPDDVPLRYSAVNCMSKLGET